ncbi:hypothetical protein M9458_038092, partial [Cirrhinus mrigala]
HPDLCTCSCRHFSLVFVWIVRVGCRRVFSVPAPDSRHHHGTSLHAVTSHLAPASPSREPSSPSLCLP